MARETGVDEVGDVGAIGIDPHAVIERVELDEHSWVDVGRQWLAGADQLFEVLLGNVPWSATKMFRYDHTIDERRLSAGWQRGTPLPHPALASIHRTLQHRYHVEFPSFSLIQYRDGGDGQGFHRDTDMKWLDDTVIAILTLGARRPWHLRPYGGRNDQAALKGATHDLAPGNGDLIVMGGRCQADWQHSVPYLGRQPVGIRISIQWRWSSRRGKPFVGASYGAPLTYG
jgi:alkylated DNA repair dioxygenase AlkB